MKRIVSEAIAISSTESLVLREDDHGKSIELHTETGAFALSSEEMQKVRAFIGSSEILDRKAEVAAKGFAKQPPPVKPSTPVVVKGKARNPRLGVRYTEEQKAEFLKGYEEAPSKAAYAKSVGVALESLRKWHRKAAK